MTTDNPKTSFNHLLVLAYTFIVAVVFALLTIVVIMLFTGTLQIVVRDLLSEQYLKAASIVSAAFIAFISLFVFVRNFKKIYNHLEKIVSNRNKQ